MTSLTVREAQPNLENLVREVVEEASQTILTTDNGEQAILMSFAVQINSRNRISAL